jgi:ABC-type Fe3+/spermidine/putrescine transport system ATPase subunit
MQKNSVRRTMLELRNIHKSIFSANGTQRELLSSLSLVVSQGETSAIMGASGSGKSTLLKIIAGLEPMDSGHVRFAGEDLANTPTHLRRFALMFQDFALFAHLNVQDNVAFGLIEQRVPKAQARARAQEMLQRFGLGAQAQQKIWTLSGGEQQRVALARALITAPRLLLLDEPFSALDADLRTSLRTEFRQHIAQAGISCVLVTHDEQEARAMAGRGYRLNHGQLQLLW